MNNTKFKEMCNEAIGALESQGDFCKTELGNCVYEYEGSCCIVGHMMPDSKCREAADNLGDNSAEGILRLTSFLEEYWKEAVDFTIEQRGALIELQGIHDGYDTFPDSINKMRNLVEGL